MRQGGAEAKGVWASGAAYDPYMGRWSRRVAAEFVAWLGVPPESRWLDVGCGTGALSRAVLDVGSPKQVVGIDLSPGYIEYARHNVVDERLSFRLGDAHAPPTGLDRFDAVVSGLALNFMAEPHDALAAMARAARAGGLVAVYVWDYADKMQLLRYFWDAAVTLDPKVSGLDEAKRSPVCDPASLTRLFEGAGLGGVETRPIDVAARFTDFNDYWSPFLGGQGTVASYAMSLSEEGRRELRELIRARLPVAPDGSIEMTIRAWAAKGGR